MKKIGVIGCGARIRHVLESIPGMGDDIRIAAIYDPSALSIKAMKSTFSLSDTVDCASDTQLLRQPDLDWIFIGSWNNAHAQQVIQAFKAGKHVFCEKPLATNREDCEHIVRAWKESSCRFCIGFTLRYSPHYRKIREIIDSGVLGQIISLEFNETLDFNHGGYIHGNWRRLRENAGTHLLEKCCHDLDLINWYVGSKARRVASFGGCNFFIPQNRQRQQDIGPSPEGKPAYESWDDPWRENPFTTAKDIADNQVAIIEFENHVRATFHTNCNTAIPERRLYLCGSEGTLRADLLKQSIEYRRIGWDTSVEEVDTSAEGGHGGGDTILGQSIRECILHNAEPFTGVEEGLDSACLAFAIDQAYDTGNVVSVTY